MLNENIFSDMERDVIGEVMNISLGSSATSLSMLLGKRVDITVPKVSVIHASEFSYEKLEPAIGVEINYVEGLNGVNLMIWNRMDAKAIIEILMDLSIPDDEFEMNEINTSAICEVMNQMMGSAATALSDFLGKLINISTPLAYEINDRKDFQNKYFIDDDVIVAVSFDLQIEGRVNSEFINVMPVLLAREIISNFLRGTEGTEGTEETEDTIDLEEDKYEQNIEYDDEDDEEIEEVEEVEEVIPVKKTKKKPEVKINKPKRKEQFQVNVKPVALDSFDNEDEDMLTEEQMLNLGLIMSVPLEINVEIGRSKRQIKDILEFSQGTIIELDKQAGALVDIIVNGKLIAKGEVVVVNDNFGVRIAEIIKKDELVKLTI